MGLNGLLDIELSVPDPAELTAFWERRRLRPTAEAPASSPTTTTC